LKAAAVQFPLGHRAVSCVVVGCRSVDQLDQSLEMFELEIPPAMWQDLRNQDLLLPESPNP
jgi:D-threo-aldose 1-dehydrogenase